MDALVLYWRQRLLSLLSLDMRAVELKSAVHALVWAVAMALNDHIGGIGMRGLLKAFPAWIWVLLFTTAAVFQFYSVLCNEVKHRRKATMCVGALWIFCTVTIVWHAGWLVIAWMMAVFALFQSLAFIKLKKGI